MDWGDWVAFRPQTKADIIDKIENDGYTYPHYDKERRSVKYVIDTITVKKDCSELNVDFSEVYPRQSAPFDCEE